MAETATDGRPETPNPTPQPRPVRKAWGIRFWFTSASLFAIAWLVAAQHWPVKYTGTAIFEVRTDPAGRDRTTPDTRPEFPNPIELTLAHDLAGRPAMERAVEELGLTRGLPREPDGSLTKGGLDRKQELVQDLMRNVVVTWDVRSDEVDLISVSFTHSDPDLVQKVPNTLVKNYIIRTSDRIIRRLIESKDFLDSQVRTADVRVTELTERRIEFESKYAGMLPETPGALQQQADQIMTDMDVLCRQRIVAVQKLDRNKWLAKAMASNPGEPVQEIRGPNPRLAELENEIRRWEAILDTKLVLEGLSDDDAVVRRIRDKIEQLKKEIKAVEESAPEVVIQKVPDPSHAGSKDADDITMEIAGAQAEVDMTASQLERLQARLPQIQGLLANYAPVRQQYLELNKRLTEQEAEKDRWQTRLTEVQMALSAEVAKRRTHLSQLQLAERQFRPESPDLTTILCFAFIGGAVVSTLLVFVHNVVNRTFARTLVWLARRLDATAVPPWPDGACAECPVAPSTQARVLTVRESRRRRFRRFVVEPVIALVLLGVMAVAVLNITLWLEFPDQYEQWHEGPWTYVSGHVADGVRSLGEVLED